MANDYDAYLNRYEDLRNAFGTDTEKAREHYEKYGKNEGRIIDQDENSTGFNLNEFQELLNRLESSKGRQQRQKSVEGRRDIFQQGLASMMSNF